MFLKMSGNFIFHASMVGSIYYPRLPWRYAYPLGHLKDDFF